VEVEVKTPPLIPPSLREGGYKIRKKYFKNTRKILQIQKKI
jgi:hypothetical protein